MAAFLRMKKNRTFSYKPRFYKGKTNPYKVEHKFDEYRTTVNYNRGLKAKIQSVLNDYGVDSDPWVRYRMLIIIAVLSLIFLWIIDFDLSIFTD